MTFCKLRASLLLLFPLLAILGAPLGCKKKAVNYDAISTQRMGQVVRRVLKADSNAVDVGCYQGAFLSALVAAAPKGRHLAFEPLPHLNKALRKKFARSRARIYEFALGDRSGHAVFTHVVSNEAYSGFKKRQYIRKNEVTRKIRVRVRTLDSLVPPGMPIALIKIDVEGAELQVLKGARRTILRNKPIIIFEHGLGSSEFYGTKPEAVYRFLNGEMGMHISLMKRWLAQERPLTRAEFLKHYHKRIAYNYIAYPK